MEKVEHVADVVGPWGDGLRGEVEEGKNYDLKFDLKKKKKSFEESAGKRGKRRKKR